MNKARTPETARIGAIVRALRKERQWTQHTLAIKTGLALITLSNLERGYYVPRAETIQKVGKAFSVDLNAVIAGPRSPWTHQIADGVLQGERARLAIPLYANVGTPGHLDQPDPVWCEFEHLPAQWFPRGRLTPIE